MLLDDLTARDVMTTKVVHAEPHETIREAMIRMDEHGIHGLVVEPTSASRGHCILTAKDCIEVLCDAGETAIDSLCVEDSMTRPAVTVPATLCLSDCIQLMRNAGIRTAPVLEGSKLVGILSFTDVLRACLGGESDG